MALMIGSNAAAMTEEQRLLKAMADIMGNTDYAAVAGVIMIGDHKIVDTGVRTACTDGVNSKYGRAFIKELSDAELRFLILHETYHCIYKHLTTWQHLYKENAQRANKACDYVINIKLVDFDGRKGWIKMPECGLLDTQYRGMDAATVYKMLADEQQDEQGSGDGDGDEGMDDHDWDAAQDMDEEEVKELHRAVDDALRQGALLAGKVGTGDPRAFDDILAAKIDWREALREFVSTTCTGNDYSTWRRPNRRFIGLDIYMPSGISETVGELVIAIDTSGSIGGRELQQFLGEISAIASSVRPSGVRLLYWDTQVRRDEYYTQDALDQIITSTKPAGGGGTSVTCVPAYMAEKSIKPQAVVVLTDGCLGGSWGTWGVPVLWCILNNKNAKPTVGTAVYIDNI